MHIVIDISSLPYGTGVSKYCAELVKALGQIDHTNQYTLFAGTLRQKHIFESFVVENHLPKNFQFKWIPISPRLQTILWNDRQLVKLNWLIGDFDLYHSLDWSLAPTNKPTIITVHDLFFLKHPELQQHPYRKTLENRLHRAQQSQLPVIAVSQTTKQDLVELIDYPADKITVIYEALPISSIHPSDWQTVQSKYQLPEKFLLMLGTLEPRKNVPRTIQAYLASDTNLPLVIVGKLGWEKLNLQPNENIHFTGFVSDADLQAIWQHTHALLYPSLYEGFGFPILEAYQHQIPVLTSANSSMQEITHSKSILVDPLDPTSITKGINQLSHLSPTQRQQIIKAGTSQLKQFSWQTTAKQTLNLYNQQHNLSFLSNL